MYLRILVPLDGSSASERGVQEALAVADPSWSRLALLHVIDTMPYMLELASQEERCAVLERLRERACEYLESVRKRALERGIKADVALVQIEQGRVADVIVDEAVHRGCDLIVMGTHGRRGLSRLALGSCTDQVARCSPLPVLLARELEPGDAGALKPRRTSSSNTALSRGMA